MGRYSAQAMNAAPMRKAAALMSVASSALEPVCDAELGPPVPEALAELLVPVPVEPPDEPDLLPDDAPLEPLDLLAVEVLVVLAPESVAVKSCADWKVWHCDVAGILGVYGGLGVTPSGS